MRPAAFALLAGGSHLELRLLRTSPLALKPQRPGNQLPFGHGWHNLWRSHLHFGVDEPPFATYFEVHLVEGFDPQPFYFSCVVFRKAQLESTLNWPAGLLQ